MVGLLTVLGAFSDASIVLAGLASAAVAAVFAVAWKTVHRTAEHRRGAREPGELPADPACVSFEHVIRAHMGAAGDPRHGRGHAACSAMLAPQRVSGAAVMPGC